MDNFHSVTATASNNCIELTFKTPDPAGRADYTHRRISIGDAEILIHELRAEIDKSKAMKRTQKEEYLKKLKDQQIQTASDISRIEKELADGK